MRMTPTAPVSRRAEQGLLCWVRRYRHDGRLVPLRVNMFQPRTRAIGERSRMQETEVGHFVRDWPCSYSLVCFLGLSAPGVPALRGLGWSPAVESTRGWSKRQVEGGRAHDEPTLLYTRISAKSG